MPEHDFRMDAVRVLPRHVICFLGPENWIESAARLVQRFGNGFSVDYEFSQDQPDDRMQEAFAACYDRVAPTMLSKDWESISAHRSVVYVLSAPLPKHQAVQASASALALTAQILRSGGMAAKSESAGLAHGRDHWLTLSASVGRGTAHETLRRAWVRRPISEGDELYSCGMHLLGSPDVSHRGFGDVFRRVDEIDWTLEQILSGTNPNPITSPCLHYEEDDFFFNPYGYVVVAGEA